MPCGVGGDVCVREEADLVFGEDFVGGVGVGVGDFILEDGGDVFAGIAGDVSLEKLAGTGALRGQTQG